MGAVASRGDAGGGTGSNLGANTSGVVLARVGVFQ